MKDKKICVIGGGWYGCHIALKLAEEGYSVTLMEKNPSLFSGISGKFGVRLHAGPHYPRSDSTRAGCRSGLEEFQAKYPEFVNEHSYSIYALGNRDAEGLPSKVDLEQFRRVCAETESVEIEPSSWGYRDMQAAINVKEPSIVVGRRLARGFEHRLSEAGVEVVYECEVTGIATESDGVHVERKRGIPCKFDHVVNATSFQNLLPLSRELPYEIRVLYQPCLALVYEDKEAKPTDQPFSFIVVEGWFPCMMPYDDRPEVGPVTSKKYIVTHGKWTIMGSYENAREAQAHLDAVDDRFIESNVKPNCEAQMRHYWPDFTHRFKYTGWKGEVLGKIKTNKEFRSAVTFRSGRVTYVVPGKVSNIFDAAREVSQLIAGTNTIRAGAYQLIRGGALHRAYPETQELITVRNTLDLQTWRRGSPKLRKPRVFAENRFANLIKGIFLLGVIVYFMLQVLDKRTARSDGVPLQMGAVLLVGLTALLGYRNRSTIATALRFLSTCCSKDKGRASASSVDKAHPAAAAPDADRVSAHL